MRRLAALALFSLGISSAAVTLAQETTPTFEPVPLQEVEVDGFTYRVSPFYPCVSVLIERTQRLSEDGILTTLTMQLFVKEGGQMVAGDLYHPDETELTALVEVGQSMPCAPQEPLDEEPLDG